jgi:hypothetical protein
MGAHKLPAARGQVHLRDERRFFSASCPGQEAPAGIKGVSRRGMQRGASVYRIATSRKIRREFFSISPGPDEARAGCRPICMDIVFPSVSRHIWPIHRFHAWPILRVTPLMRQPAGAGAPAAVCHGLASRWLVAKMRAAVGP